MIDVERLCAEFSRQAAIASPSYHEGEIARYLAKRLRELGAEVVFDEAGTRVGGEVGNLVARFPATGKEGEPLLFSLHMDTVSPCRGVVPVLQDGRFVSAGETILGADDKAGIAELFEALAVVREQQIPHVPLEVVVTICEEVGLVGAKQFDPRLVEARRALALDTSGVDRLIHRAPGANKLRIEVLGREAHAGIAPEKGVSAIEVVSRAIARMPLGRIDAQTTANIGTIHGGEATNIVAKRVVVEGEARSHCADTLKRQTAAMVACFEQAADELSRELDGERFRPQVKCEVLSDYPIMHVPLDAPVIGLVEQACAGLGRNLEVTMAGGGSDANIFNQAGIETVILGTGMDRVHTVDETVTVADLVKVSELLVEVIRRA